MNFKIISIFLTSFLSPIISAQVELGRKEIQEGMRAARPVWSRNAFLALSQVWGKNLSPGSPEFKKEILGRYGLAYDADFINDGLPVGLTQTTASISDAGDNVTGLTVSCEACHTANMSGKPLPGIANVFFDYQRFNHDMKIAMNDDKKAFFESNPDRNSMVTYSNYMGRLSIFIRDVFPLVNLYKLYAVFADPNPRNALITPLLGELPDRELVKTQSWNGYKYKRQIGSGLYVDGGFYGSPSSTHYAIHLSLDTSGLEFLSAVQRFDQIAPPYLSSLDSPKYPKATDPQKVGRGAALYKDNCASCHGSFSKAQNGFSLDYPGKLIARESLGTDTLRIDYRINYDNEIPEAVRRTYKKTGKYIAPPLVGIWARAPYFHNASVPTLEQVLNSSARVRKYGIEPSFVDKENFDWTQVGWSYADLSSLNDSEIEALKNKNRYLRIYDPGVHAGMKNSGHTYGDSLNQTDRADLIEFLKAI